MHRNSWALKQRLRARHRCLHLLQLEQRLLLTLDFGDAPFPYRTLISEGGASHVATGPLLGAVRLTEEDGNHSLLHADDDGVRIRYEHTGIFADVTVTGDAILNAWIDFNGDGSWDGGNERVANNLPVTSGQTTIRLDAPQDLPITSARFRLSTTGGIGPYGPATDGEVEDYWRLLNHTREDVNRIGHAGNRITIDPVIDGVGEVLATDLDRDGDQDLLVAHPNSQSLVWYDQRPGQFALRSITTGTLPGIRKILTANLDANTQPDLITLSDNGVDAFFSSGDGNFIRQTLTPIPSTASDLVLGDMDSDGDLDLVFSSVAPPKLSLLDNNGDGSYTERVLSETAGTTVQLFDLNRDNYLDILVAEPDRLSWYQNDASQQFTPHPLVELSDVTEFQTVMRGTDSTIFVVTNNGTNRTAHRLVEIGSQQYEAEVVSGLHAIRGLWTGFFDVTRLEVIATTTEGVYWNEALISDTEGSEQLVVTDINSDGFQDVVVFGDSVTALLGEYEDPTLDFGDAPEPYLTTIAQGGPAHVATGPSLTSTRDAELDATPGIGATSDGGLNPFFRTSAGDQLASYAFSVRNASGLVDVWIDHDRDGTWVGPDEHILDSVGYESNLNNIEQFAHPYWSSGVDTFARLRVNSSDDLGIVGLALDGEVEDTVVRLDPLDVGHGEWLQQSLAPMPHSLGEIHAADLNSDGALDLVTLSADSRELTWHQNNRRTFIPHTLNHPFTELDQVMVVDLGHDGNRDILFTAPIEGYLGCFENLGDGRFELKMLVRADVLAGLYVADMDLDGDSDIITAAEGNLVWYRRDDGGPEWQVNTISEAPAALRDIRVVDVNRDGQADVVAITSNGILWHERLGLSNEYGSAREIMSSVELTNFWYTDLDGDLDLDWITVDAGTSTISWHEHDGGNFTSHPITNNMSEVADLVAVDFDADEDIDLVTTGRNGTIHWFANNGGVFDQHLFATTTGEPIQSFPFDWDTDGDLDLLATRRNGELEYFENRLLYAGDFGDAPAPYLTTHVEFGAAHGTGGPRLGTLWSDDGEGAHSADASGDDDDGVQISNFAVAQHDAQITVDVQERPGRLDAWIDFDGDGTWSGGQEKIFTAVPLSVGQSTLEFAVPADARPGTTFARFRISRDGETGPYGFVDNGEVEDYAVTITPPNPSPGWLTSATLTSGQRQDGLVQFDYDNDGDIDLVSSVDGVLTLLENQGDAQFTQHPLHIDRPVISPSHAGDFDNDGDLDFQASSPETLYWFENQGDGNFLTHEIDRLSYTPDVLALDIDGDGDIDFLQRDFTGYLHWWKNSGDGTFTFESLRIAHDERIYNVQPYDWNSDGHFDLLGWSDSGLFALESDGGSFVPKKVTDAGFRDAAIADFDEDGDSDLIVGHSTGRLALLENVAGELVERPLTGDLNSLAVQLTPVDLDGDGDLDVGVHFTFGLGRLMNQDGNDFSLHIDTTGALGSVKYTDLDADMDVDVVATSRTSDGEDLRWFENGGPALLDFGDAPREYAITLDTNTTSFYRAVGPMLGSDRTVERDGQPSPEADQDSGDDGVRFLTPLIAGELAQVEVTVSELPARVSGVIDFDTDYIFWRGSNRDELIIDDVELTSLTQVFEFMVPSDAYGGRTFVEFSVDDGQDIFPRNGEIEHYPVQVVSNQPGPPTVADIQINRLLDFEQLGPTPPTDWQTQRSNLRQIEIEFSESVALTVDDVQLLNHGVTPGADPIEEFPLRDQHLSFDGQTLVLSFLANELSAGVYELILSDSVADRGGDLLDGDGDGVAGGEYRLRGSEENRFYVLTADFNGDGGTTVFDFSPFAFWFGSESAPLPTHILPTVPTYHLAPEYVDLNADGGVSIFDFNRFSSAFDTNIMFLAPARRFTTEQGTAPYQDLERSLEQFAAREAENQINKHHLLGLLFDWGRIA